MTTVTLRIKVDNSGATEEIREVRDGLKEVGTTGEQASRQATTGVGALTGAVNSVKAAIGAFVAAFAAFQALSGVVRLADEYQSLNDRLRLATGSAEEFARAQQGVFTIAQSSGTALGAVSDLYSRLARSTGELGLSTGELLTITEAINQAFLVSGAGAAESDAAIRQLGQAFASGTLRGDEFNSVMENAPRLSQALADSLGITVGELRKLAQEGKLTSDVLAQGLLGQAPAIAAEFDQMGLTVGRAFTILSNSVLQFVGEANEATGAGNALAQSIVFIANALPAIVAGLTGVAAGYVAVKAAAIAANPAIAFTGTALAGVTTALGVLAAAFLAFQFGKQLADDFVAVRAAGAALVVGLNDVWNAIKTGAVAAFAAIRVAWFTVIDQIQERTADLIDAFVELSQIELPFDLRADFTYGAADAMRQLADNLRRATDATEENDRALGFLQDQMERGREETDRFAAEMFDAVDAHFDARRAADQNTAAHTALRPALSAVATEANRAGQSMQTAAASANVFRGAVASGTASASAFAGAVATGTLALEDFDAGARQSGQSANEWAGYWEAAGGQVADAFGDFVASGLKSFSDFKDSLKRLAQQIISDLVSTFVRNRIVIPITAALTGGPAGANTGQGGGGFGGFQNLPPFLQTAAQGAGVGGLIGGTNGAIGGAILSVIGTAVLGPIGGIIGSIVGGLLGKLFDDDDPLLRVRSSEFSGPRRSEGRSVSQLGNIFIRTEDLGDGAPTSPEIANRIRDFDNLIAGFLTPQQIERVRSALSNVNATFREGAATLERALGDRLSTIVGQLSDDVQRFVGSAGTLEERVARLADALAVEALISGPDAITDSFDELATLLEEFRQGNEGLAQTYQRLSAGVSLVDFGLELVKSQFEGTRLEAAAFAGELIRLSGGFDQFAQRFDSALRVLFTDEERAQVLASQAQRTLNQALADLGIQGTGVADIREQLRALFRQGLESGDANLLDLVLRATSALGLFTDSLSQLGEDAVNAYNDVVFGSRGDGFKPAAAGGSGGAGPAAPTQADLQADANRFLGRQVTLLESIEANTRPGPEEARATKSVQNTESLTREQTRLLNDILAALRQQTTQTVQLALKKTVKA